jgi:cytochrome c peroxidase
MKHTLLPVLVPLFFAACAEPTAHAGEGPPVGKPGTFPLPEIQGMVKQAALHVAFVPEAPLGLTHELAASLPADNPLTRAKVELGSQLYFDPRLSKDQTRACATCHHPSQGWAESKPAATGASRARNAPTIANRLLGRTQFWDGRVKSLEEQALVALGNPGEMGFSAAEGAARLNSIEGYRLQFEAVFGGPATPERIAKALAAFERTILSGESKNDVYERALPFLEREPGDGEYVVPRKEALDAEARQRMSESALRGRALFLGKAKCSTCHAGPDLTDELFYNLGVGMDRKDADLGRFVVTQVEKDKGAFKTPTVRNVAKTAPYMHDGSLATLRAVVDHYDKGGTKNPWLSGEIVPLGLSEQDKQDLVAFLEEGLSGQTTPVSIPRLP